jgi:hypothetical protein
MIDNTCVDLQSEYYREFQVQGFVRIPHLITDNELAWLRDIFDAIIKRETGLTPPAFTRKAGEGEPPTLVKTMTPERHVPVLSDMPFWRRAHQIVAHLLGVTNAQLRCDGRLFMKPAHSGATPWHQDAAYRPPPHHGANVWIPLDPATLERGCMQYIAHSHREVIRPHYDRGDYLIAEGFDVKHAVACPLMPGEAVVHHFRTLHGACANQTDEPRRAVVIVGQAVADALDVREGSTHCAE